MDWSQLLLLYFTQGQLLVKHLFISPFTVANLVHLPTSRHIFITRKMNIVNIRTAPIKRIHQRGVEIMSKKKKRHDKKKNTGHKALGDKTFLQARKKIDRNLKELWQKQRCWRCVGKDKPLETINRTRGGMESDGHTRRKDRRDGQKHAHAWLCWSNRTWLKRSCSSGVGPHRWGKLYSSVKGYL